MNKQTYKELIEELTEYRRGISKGKRRDYTRESEDVLKNFKNQAEALGITPETSLAVHMEKQFAAILTYIKTDGDSQSEPIKNRISDCLNYLELLYGLIQEKDEDILIDDSTDLIKPKFRRGDIVEIVGNTAGHDFDIGEIVTLTKYIQTSEYSKNFWKAINDEEDAWEVYEEDIKLVKSTNRSTGI